MLIHMCGAAGSGVAQIFLFRKFSSFFKKRVFFYKYWDIPHVKKALYQHTIQKYMNW